MTFARIPARKTVRCIGAGVVVQDVALSVRGMYRAGAEGEVEAGAGAQGGAGAGVVPPGVAAEVAVAAVGKGQLM